MTMVLVPANAIIAAIAVKAERDALWEIITRCKANYAFWHVTAAQELAIREGHAALGEFVTDRLCDLKGERR